jgi:ferric-dicitrate binding protein FerR (iron transport regulator)
MSTHPNPIDEVLDLCEQRIEGRLTQESAARLEKLVRENSEARRACVEYLHQHASLFWNVGSQSDFSIEALERASEDKIVSLLSASPADWTGRRSTGRRWPRFTALAASVTLAATVTWVILHFTGSGRTQPALVSAAKFATLVETKNVRWNSGSLPTEPGSRLASGRLRLDQGLAILHFDNGVKVVLEAPADFELISPAHCILHAGVVVAEVPPPTTRFVIETVTAWVTDYGTEFGISVGPEGETQVQVLEGAVDVQHRPSGRTERLIAGKSAWVSAIDLTVADTTVYEPRRAALSPPGVEPPASIVTLTTASGRGKDVYIQGDQLHPHRSDVLLLVKNTGTEGFSRKAYLGFDLSGAPVNRIREARLILTMTPTGYGYASMTGETTFSLYGLTDQSVDDWTESEINWENAPANRPGGAEVDPAKATHLGSFAVGEGVTSGQFSIAGEALAEFLRQDTNGIATFILVRDSEVVRESPGQHPRGLVHGFESSRHPTGTPPMLRIRLDQVIARGE